MRELKEMIARAVKESSGDTFADALNDLEEATITVRGDRIEVDYGNGAKDVWKCVVTEMLILQG